jgi:hypothetical protein
MLRAVGVRVIPRGAIVFLTLATVLLVSGWFVHLLSALLGWSSLFSVELILLGSGAVCAILAVVRAARGR